MNSLLPLTFPQKADTGSDYNPGIRLFGKRFIKEQTVLEYAVEFMAVVFSDKWINSGEVMKTPFPALSMLQEWSTGSNKLHYRPPIKLNLKLFAFMGSSPVDSRHAVHQEQYRKLVRSLQDKIVSGDGKVNEKLELLEKLLQGFQGAGFNRNWCAQCFFPISPKLLVQETIWNESVVKREPVSSWDDCIRKKKYFSSNKHNFMARGGELLYLQLCNLFVTEKEKVKDFAQKLSLKPEESDPEKLYAALQKNLGKLQSRSTEAFDHLIDMIENLDQATHFEVNSEAESQSCEWCPRESWPESLLFAVELNRLMQSMLDPVERLKLFIAGCALQVLRSLCAQSARYAERDPHKSQGNILGYAWMFITTGSASRQQRLASQRNLQQVQGLIQKALRSSCLIEHAGKHPRKEAEVLLREADTRYGHKLFLYLGKKLGIIAPFKGPGARFVMTDDLLRYLVLVLLRPGERCTYDDFLHRLYLHYGIAIEGEHLDDALSWSGYPANSSVNPGKSSWLSEMLRAGGFLTELSDACSIVSNDFAEKATPTDRGVTK